MDDGLNGDTFPSREGCWTGHNQCVHYRKGIVVLLTDNCEVGHLNGTYDRPTQEKV